MILVQQRTKISFQTSIFLLLNRIFSARTTIYYCCHKSPKSFQNNQKGVLHPEKSQNQNQRVEEIRHVRRSLIVWPPQMSRVTQGRRLLPWCKCHSSDPAWTAKGKAAPGCATSHTLFPTQALLPVHTDICLHSPLCLPCQPPPSAHFPTTNTAALLKHSCSRSSAASTVLLMACPEEHGTGEQGRAVLSHEKEERVQM